MPEGDEPKSKSSVTDDAASRKDAILAARRASISPGGGEAAKSGTPHAPSKRPAGGAKPRTRKLFVVLGVLLALALLAGGGVLAKQALYERSDDGRVHGQLLAWEFGADPGARENAFSELDRMGPKAMAAAIDKLTDSSIAERGESHSTRTVQVIAHHYVMHLATVAKAPPPKEGAEIAKALFDGATPNSGQWTGARDAWRKWLADQQARGALPK